MWNLSEARAWIMEKIRNEMSSDPKIPGMRTMKPIDSYVAPCPIDFKNERSWTWIILHHSYSPDYLKVNDWKGITKYHTSWRYQDNIITPDQAKILLVQGKDVIAPWPTNGYHAGVEYDNVNGVPKVVYRMGAPLSRTGYHTIGFNEKAIGICLTGNFGGKFDGTDGKAPSLEMITAGLKLVRYLAWHYKIPTDHIIGHREAYKLLGKPVEKTCPGSHFSIESFRAQI